MSRKTYFSINRGILFLACGAVAGQEADLIQKVAARQTIALSGSWQAIVDPYEAGAAMMPVARLATRHRITVPAASVEASILPSGLKAKLSTTS